MRDLRFLTPLLSVVLGVSCSSGPPADPGVTVPGGFSDAQTQELAAIQQQIDACSALSTDDFLAAHALPQAASVSYDPSQALGLGLLQASSLALDADELDALDAHGFVISNRSAFPTFTYGYASIYAQDLPLYVSADSILHAVHRSYDEILKRLEHIALIPDLQTMLASMRSSLASGGVAAFDAETVADVDLYVAVATALLTGQSAAPQAGGSSSDIDELVSGAEAASGTKVVRLFGVDREVDLSQFEPRGHYADEPLLSRYFRAMMWLGRIDLRILETQPDHSQRFYRRQLMGAFALRALLDAGSTAKWQQIHDTIAGFVGEPDAMTLPELAALLDDLGVSSPSGLDALSDDTIVAAVLAGGYGQQSISGHIMYNGLGAGTMPLSSAFLLFGQAYVVDSHVFSNLVFDRVGGGSLQRMMPNPLDVSFAALKNDQAASLLSADLDEHPYAPDLCSMRAVVEAHGDAFWQGDLYNLWLSTLRTLSPGPEVGSPAAVGLPAVAGTEAWGRRLANTQLASWAELRHDTILYAKQSYTSGDACEFPDAYVEPYPQFFAALGAYAEHGKAILAALSIPNDSLKATIDTHFDRLSAAASKLGAMAQQERTGAPFTAEQMAFINQAVVVQMMCGGDYATGWFPDLYFTSPTEFDPTIADVHTQPTEVGGAPVGRVLHVATGLPRLMVVTADTCSGPRAYVGLASSYFERLTENYQRLTDEQWKDELNASGAPADVAWMKDIVVR